MPDYDASDSPDPTPESTARFIVETWPDTAVAEIPGAWFFSLDPVRHFPNFATIVTNEDHDQASDLNREGAWRLNIGVGKASFERLVGSQLAAGDVDYTVVDTILPHPVYAAQRFVCVLNPSRRTFDSLIVPLLEEAYRRVERQHRLQAGAAPDPASPHEGDATPPPARDAPPSGPSARRGS